MENEYSAMIIDDSDIAVKLLEQQLKYFDNIRVVSTASNATDGLTDIMKHRPDLLFLDIRMPEISGLDLLRHLHTINDWGMKVVMHSAFIEQAFEAQNEQAFGFLEKPYSIVKLGDIVERFLKQNKLERKAQNNFNTPKAGKEESKIKLKTYDGTRMVTSNQIGYLICEKQQGQPRWYVVLTNHEKILLGSKIFNTTILAYSPDFIQINRQQIININFFSTIKADKCFLLEPFDKGEHSLIIKRDYLAPLRERITLL